MAHWTPAQLEAHEMKLLRKGIIINQSEKPRKYRNKITVADGLKFHSKKEAGRYLELIMMERARMIFDLKTQVSFPLICDTLLVTSGRMGAQAHPVKLPYKLIKEFICDFTYLNEKNELILEDTKGYLTKEFKLKRRLMRAVYGYEIKIT